MQEFCARAQASIGNRVFFLRSAQKGDMLMSEKLTCPLCGHNETFTLIPHVRNEHKVEPDALRRQFPEQALANDELCRFISERRVQRRSGILRYQLPVAGDVFNSIVR